MHGANALSLFDPQKEVKLVTIVCLLQWCGLQKGGATATILVQPPPPGGNMR